MDTIKICLSQADDFPCDLNAITLMSLPIGAGGIALLFVVFLYYKVRHLPPLRRIADRH